VPSLRLYCGILPILLFGLAKFFLASPSQAQESERKGTIVEGMNIVNPQLRSVAGQNELIEELRQYHVHVVRCSIKSDEKGIDFAKRLYAAGIKLDLILHSAYPPDAPVRPAQLSRFPGMATRNSLSDASPELSTKVFQKFVDLLDSNGIQVAGFELDNEINWAAFNGEFPLPGQGRVFTLQDLNKDPEARQIAKGFLQYIKILAVLKEVRGASSLNRNAPIISAGLANFVPPGMESENREDAVTINATLKFLRQHGSDDFVDAYGVHVYPQAGSSAELKSYLEAHVVTECTTAKPCWITEWGFRNNKLSCPPKDGARATAAQNMMDAVREFVKQGTVTGQLLFSWDAGPPEAATFAAHSLYRCGELSKAGKEALEPLRP
jgi:hypothetical protein